MNAMDYVARLSHMGADDGEDYLGEIMDRHGYNNTREIPYMVARIEYNRINAKRNAPQPVPRDWRSEMLRRFLRGH